MLYRPRLPNGQMAPLSWPLTLYRLCNIICWPLEDNVSRVIYILDRILFLLGFLIYSIHLEGDFRYLQINWNNLDTVLRGIPSFLVLVAVYFRAFQLGMNKDNFKRLLKNFYAEIYIEESLYPELFRNTKQKFPLIQVIFAMYLSTLIIYLLVPIHLLSIGSKQLLYNMITFYDINSIYIYLPSLLGTIWIGFISSSMLFGEPNILSLQIFHLNGRYQLMRENLLTNVNKLLKIKEKEKEKENIIFKFHKLLIETIEENIRLNRFAQEVQREFSYRLFITMALWAASLCGMVFKLYTSPKYNLGFVPWGAAIILETIAYGQIGTSLYETTDSIGSMYYESKWESIIELSSDTKANVSLMKLINLTMLINRKPFKLKGLNFLEASLSTSVTILQCAYSYFTFLTSLS